MPPPIAPPSRREAVLEVIGRAAEAFLLGGRPLAELIDRFVAALGDAAGASRAWVLRFHPEADGGARGLQVAEWCAPGVEAPMAEGALRDVSFAGAGLDRWWAAFRAGDAVVADGSIGQLAERRILAARGASCIGAAPITVDGEPWGAIGFDHAGPPRNPDGGALDALRSAARLVAAALARAAADERRAARQTQESLYRAIAQHFPGGAVTIVDRDLRFVLADGQGFRVHGRDPTQLTGRPVREGLDPAIAELNVALYERALAGEEASARAEWGGHTFEIRAVPIREADGEVQYVFGVVTDLTGQLRAEQALREREQQLLRAQKVEALGRLAGGIAHDFNNLLTVIGTSAELALEALAPDHPAVADVEQARRGAERGALLTRQLLAFARQQPAAEPRLLAVNDIVMGALSLLQRVSGTGRPIELDLTPGVGAVCADRSQLEQVLVNLVVNALDATRDGGTITVSTARVPGPDVGLVAHEAIVLAVRDTGVGMDAATLERAFEPFFTTKPLGRGTGLGLATVAGLVEQAGGRVLVESAPGAGSTFRVVLPRLADDAPMAEPPASDQSRMPPHGTETVLVVDDEAAVRTSVRRLLVSHGYRVLEAKHGRDALLELERQPAATVALVLTDIVMPELDGPSLAAQLRQTHPGLPVLFMSGYDGDLLAQHERVGRDEVVIGKPFTGRELLVAVRERLDRAADSAA